VPYFHVTPPLNLTIRRAWISVDLMIAGQRFGQQAEALITVLPRGEYIEKTQTSYDR
jgi:hypothetical protein